MVRMPSFYPITQDQSLPLHSEWEMLITAPGSYQHPDDLAQADHHWLTATVPGTVIETLHAHQQWYPDHPLNVDSQDCWYRCTFTTPLGQAEGRLVLKFAGLATVSDIWLNEQHILTTENMFRSYEVDVTQAMLEKNTLYIRFSSLQTLLAQKRPRPRWRTQLVDQQQLRWFRTTLLGRMPSWTPLAQPVGPWRAITLEQRSQLILEQLLLKTSVHDKTGQLFISLKAQNLGRELPEQATLQLANQSFALAIQQDSTDGTLIIEGTAHISDVRLWWPHTHGGQPLYQTEIVLHYGTETISIQSGHVAFRTIEWLDNPQQNFGLRVNGVPIFCRGACWTPLDSVRLTGTKQAYEEAIELAQNAGINMLRVGGTMVYEDDIFYTLCDRAGILVWQDFMFANMDYPMSQAAFYDNCLQETLETLQRLHTHPCLALLCGNSEVAQQVAMLGLPTELQSNRYFEQELPQLCRQYVDVPYWSSTPNGGTLPFQANKGNAHYQGVGAFLRPLSDARSSEVRFASECLAFANIPEAATLDRFLKPGEQTIHHPKWKARVPRDFGATWDFEDVRDHYLQVLFGVEPLKLRYTDSERYKALSRVVPGEVIAATIAEWRRQKSVNNGALIWFYRDFWPGIGWGIIDATGYPKAAYYYLRRVAQAQTCFFSDEGLNGLWLHALNDTAQATSVNIQVQLYRTTGTLLATTTQDVQLAAHGESSWHLEECFGHFMDLTYAYRFGPPSYDFAYAVMTTAQDHSLKREAFYFPHGLPTTQEQHLGLQAAATPLANGNYILTIHTEKFAQSIAIQTEHFIPEDNYFHLPPQGSKTVLLRPQGGQTYTLRGSVSALNTPQECNIDRSFGRER